MNSGHFPRRIAWGLIGLASLLAFSACARHVPAVQNQAPTAPVAMFGDGPGRNMVNLSAKKLPSDWSVEEGKQRSILWSAPLGSISYGGPVVAGGKVFVGTNNQNPRDPKIKGDKGVLMCFDEKTGKLLWQAVHDKLPNQDENDWPMQGVASTPAVVGDRLYYVSNRCELICADVNGTANGTAKVVWSLDMIKELNVFPCFLANCAPLVVDDMVYVLTGNGVDAKHKVAEPKAPSFLAVNKDTGKVVWQSNLPGDKIMEGQWSNPTYAQVNGKGQVIFPGGDGWLYSLDAKKGELIWKFDTNPKKAIYKPEGTGTRNYIVATPVVYDNKLYIGVGQNPEYAVGEGRLWCIDLTKTGDISPVDDNFDPKAAVNKKSGLIWHFGGQIMPRPDRGRAFHFGRTISTAAIHDGLLYVPDMDGFLYCLDAKTGQKLWDHDFVAGVWCSPMYIDGKVYIGADDGNMYIFEAANKRKLIAKIDMNGQLKSPVAASNSVLFVMTDKVLYAIGAK